MVVLKWKHYPSYTCLNISYLTDMNIRGQRLEQEALLDREREREWRGGGEREKEREGGGKEMNEGGREKGEKRNTDYRHKLYFDKQWS